MSLVVGYLLAELLVQGEGTSTALSPHLQAQVDRQRVALQGLTRKQRAATLVAALRPAPRPSYKGRLATSILQRVFDPNAARAARIEREQAEVGPP